MKVNILILFGLIAVIMIGIVIWLPSIIVFQISIATLFGYWFILGMLLRNIDDKGDRDES